MEERKSQKRKRRAEKINGGFSLISLGDLHPAVGSYPLYSRGRYSTEGRV